MFRFNPAAFFPPSAAATAAGNQQHRRFRELNPSAAQLPPVYVANPAQINPNCRLYQVSPTRPAPPTWAPAPQLSQADLSYLGSDEFRMYGFKIAKCLETRSHDWTVCPYAHPGEKARRRDPRKVKYLAMACPEFRASGRCRRGETCLFAHGVFEYWLHPARYRTRACNSGEHCRRKVCFFAHGPTQLRPETRYRFMYGQGSSGAVIEEVSTRPWEEVRGGAGGSDRMPQVEEPDQVEGIYRTLAVEEVKLETIRRISGGINDNGGSLMGWGSSNLNESESEYPDVGWIDDLIE